jgi:hypothetical protein
MKSKGFAGLALIVAALAFASADAQSLKVRQRMLDQERELLHDAKSTNKECEAEFLINFDWSAAPEEKLSEFSEEAYCDAALTAIRRICGDGTGKKAVQEKSKSVTCGFGPARAIALKDGALDYTMSYPSTNDSDFVYEFLENHL